MIMKETIFQAAQNPNTAAEIFRTLGGITADLSARGKKPCEIGCGGPGTPAGISRMSFEPAKRNREQGYILYCHVCHANGKPTKNVIDAVMDYQGVDFKEACQIIGERFGLVDTPRGEWRAIREAPKPEPAQIPLWDPEKSSGEDQTAYYRECAESLMKSPRAIEYLKSRGISLDTARKYWLGYTDHVLGTSKRTGLPFDAGAGIIFPVTRWTWEARIIEPKMMKSIKYGESGIWNWRALKQSASSVFIAEGIFNALTWIEAGRRNGVEWQAVALGGVGGVETLVRYLVEIRKDAPLPQMTAALDNDKAGKDATQRLARLAAEHGIEFQTIKY